MLRGPQLRDAADCTAVGQLHFSLSRSSKNISNQLLAGFRNPVPASDSSQHLPLWTAPRNAPWLSENHTDLEVFAFHFTLSELGNSPCLLKQTKKTPRGPQPGGFRQAGGGGVLASSRLAVSDDSTYSYLEDYWRNPEGVRIIKTGKKTTGCNWQQMLRGKEKR